MSATNPISGDLQSSLQNASVNSTTQNEENRKSINDTAGPLIRRNAQQTVGKPQSLAEKIAASIRSANLQPSAPRNPEKEEKIVNPFEKAESKAAHIGSTPTIKTPTAIESQRIQALIKEVAGQLAVSAQDAIADLELKKIEVKAAFRLKLEKTAVTQADLTNVLKIDPNFVEEIFASHIGFKEITENVKQVYKQNVDLFVEGLNLIQKLTSVIPNGDPSIEEISSMIAKNRDAIEKLAQHQMKLCIQNPSIMTELIAGMQDFQSKLLGNQDGLRSFTFKTSFPVSEEGSALKVLEEKFENTQPVTEDDVANCLKENPDFIKQHFRGFFPRVEKGIVMSEDLEASLINFYQQHPRSFASIMNFESWMREQVKNNLRAQQETPPNDINRHMALSEEGHKLCEEAEEKVLVHLDEIISTDKNFGERLETYLRD